MERKWAQAAGAAAFEAVGAKVLAVARAMAVVPEAGEGTGTAKAALQVKAMAVRWVVEMERPATDRVAAADEATEVAAATEVVVGDGGRSGHKMSSVHLVAPCPLDDRARPTLQVFRRSPWRRSSW